MKKFKNQYIAAILISAFIISVIPIQSITDNNVITDESKEKKDSNNDITNNNENIVDMNNPDNWGYSEWRQYVILQYYNKTEEELDDSLLNDEKFQHNLHIVTIMAWGQYNGSLNEEDLINLADQLYHNSVSVSYCSASESSDERLYLNVEIRIYSELLLYYEVTDIEVFFKSQYSSGKWSSWTRKVHDGVSLKDNDLFDFDSTYHHLHYNIHTGSRENHLNVQVKATYKQTLIPVIPIPIITIHSTSRYYYTDLRDDDTSRPSIYANYYGGGTDGNPGYFAAYSSDSSGSHITSSNPQYLTSSLGWHYHTFTAVDHDNDRAYDSLSNSRTFSKYIVDDDTSSPVIHQIIYDSTPTDGESIFPVKLSVSDQSGIDVIYGDFSGSRYYASYSGGYYHLNLPNPGVLGSHRAYITIVDNDKDRPGDQLVTTTSISFEAIDDDVTPPIIQEILYNSIILDSKAQLIIKVTATDDSGIGGINALFDGNFYYGIAKNGYFEITIPNPGVLGDHSVLILVMDGDLDRPGDQLLTSQSIQFSVVDDDISGPIISISYTGDALDSNPGVWTVIISDPESGIDSIIVKIDGTIVGNSAGDYLVPNTLGTHTISVIATNADLDRGPSDQETSSESNSVVIVDDDTTGPVISIMYTGGGLDSNPGFWTVSIDDLESGIDTITVKINGIQVGASPGDYLVPNALGTHTISVSATNADLDRGPSDQETSSESNSVIIVDDDTTSPLISITYTGSGLDSNPGFWTVSVDDPESGIDSIIVEIDGTTAGTSADDYLVPNVLGTHMISVFATNADLDRGPMDQESSTQTNIVTITDDDISPPDITVSIGITEPTSYGFVVPLTIQASDESGITDVYIEIEDYIFKTLGTHYVVLLPGTYLLKVWVTDADNDRPNDALIAYQEIIVEVLDLWPPSTELIIEDYYESPEGKIYVNFNSKFVLSAKDDFSEVAHTYYRINGGDWIEYSGPFSLNLALGTYLIEYFSVDTESNEEIPKSSIFLFEEIYSGCGCVRISKKCYHGEAKLYLSENLIRLDLCEQSIEWEIKKAWKCKNFEFYFGCGELGRIFVKVCRCNKCSCLLAVGRKVFFIGILEEMPEPEEPPPEEPM